MQKEFHYKCQKLRRHPKVVDVNNIFKALLPIFIILTFEGAIALPQEQPHTFVILKEKKIRVEVARSEGEKARGLMFRESLAKEEGMLFVYDREEILSFWMKNTRIPLSIAFIDKNGKILELQDMEPFSLRTHVSARPAKYALEVNQGWFKKNGIEVGDVIKLPPDLWK